jgi:hypothetical protein
MVRDAGPVQQARVAVLAIAVDPFRGAWAGDAHLGGDMRDRTGPATLHKTAAALDGQRGITVKHGRVFLIGRTGWWYFSSCRRKTCPPVQAPSGVNNLMTRNN